MKTPISKAIKSKSMIAGFGLIGMGAYVIIMQKDVTGGITIIGVGLGIVGIRDAV